MKPHKAPISVSMAEARELPVTTTAKLQFVEFFLSLFFLMTTRQEITWHPGNKECNRSDITEQR